jgi:hypothetical protein
MHLFSELLVCGEPQFNSSRLASLIVITEQRDRLCGLVARVPGCRLRDPGFDSRHYQIFCVAVGLERGPLSLVSINEELLERNPTEAIPTLSWWGLSAPETLRAMPAVA